MAMAYVAIDVQGVRDLAKVLRDTATRAEAVRRETVGGLKLADLSSQAPLQLALVQDGFSRLANGVADKANVAEQFVLDPQGVAAQLGVPVAELATAITAGIGVDGLTDLRTALVGLARGGADPAASTATPATQNSWTAPNSYETSYTRTDSSVNPTGFVTDW
jgi:hypothetical protein